ncbi:MAG TPA: T9SS type A sorting domain-containing protein [bacterium]|jgi:hypothetical protein
MRQLLAIAAALICVGQMFAQPQPDTLWTRTYGGNQWDIAQSVQQTLDGGYVLAGYSDSYGAGDLDFYVVKTDSQGTALWSHHYGGDNDELGYDIQQTPDSGFVVVGSSTPWGGHSDVSLVKTNSQGVVSWTRSYGGSGDDYAVALERTADSGFVMAGHTTSFGTGLGNMYVVKTNANGDTLWTRSFGGGGNDGASSIQQTADGGYVIAGFTLSFGAGFRDIYVVKTDGAGDTLWTRTYGGRQDDNAYSIRQTADGGYVIAGSTESYGAGYTDVYVVKTDSEGDTLWTRVFGSTQPDAAYSVRETPDGGYVVAGYTWISMATARDFCVVKLNGQGQTVWTRTYGGNGSEEANCLRMTADGGYVVAGFTTSRGAGGDDFYLVKTGPDAVVTVPHISVTPALLNFGETVVGDSVILPLRISSTGNGNLTVDRITLPADFHADFGTAQVLEPGDSVVVRVRFVPTAAREYADTLYVHSDAADSVVAVRLQGTAQPNRAGQAALRPAAYGLRAYPNPFNPAAQIAYTLPHAGHVSVTVSNLLGQELTALVDEMQAAGTHTIQFDGAALPAGVYLCRLEARAFVRTTKLVLLK